MLERSALAVERVRPPRPIAAGARLCVLGQSIAAKLTVTVVAGRRLSPDYSARSDCDAVLRAEP